MTQNAPKTPRHRDDSNCLDAAESGAAVSASSKSRVGHPTRRVGGHYARLCALPLLGADRERALFTRLSWQRRRGARLRQRKAAGEAGLAPEIHDAANEAMRLRDHLVMSNVRLAVSLAGRFVTAATPLDYLLSTALTSLIAAVEKFDVERGFRFSTYATQLIRRDLYRYMKKENTHQTRFQSGSDNGIWDRVEEQRSNWGGEADPVILLTQTIELLDRLETRERLVLRARFGFESNDDRKTTYTALGRRLGVSKERARQIAERALKKLKDMAEKAGMEPPL